MIVRPMTTSDLRSVAALLKSSFDPDLRAYMTYTQEGIDAFLGVRISKPELSDGRTYLVYSDDSDRAVGYAEFVQIEPGVQFLSYLCVAPHMRRRGVATSMIDYLVRSNDGTGRVELEVFDRNASALALYRNLGYVPVKGGRTWSRRGLPDAAPIASADLAIPELTVYEPMHAAYGFSQLPVVWRGRAVALGRIGSTVLRCFDIAAFTDDSLLAAVRRTFPSLTEAFLVNDTNFAPGVGAKVITGVTRMARIVHPQPNENGSSA